MESSFKAEYSYAKKFRLTKSEPGFNCTNL